MIKLTNSAPVPAPEPATPTVAAPMPVNLAAVSISQEKTLVWYSCLATWSGTLLWEGCPVEISGLLRKEADKGLMGPLVEEWIRAGGMRGALALCFLSLLASALLSDARLTHPLHYVKLHGGHLPTPPASTSGHARYWSVLSFTFKHHVSLKKKKKVPRCKYKFLSLLVLCSEVRF